MKKFNMKKLAIAVVAGAVWSSAAVGAAQETTNLSVSATVDTNCIIGASPTLGFGLYDATGADHDTAATIDVTCTNGASVTITLDPGLNPVTAGSSADGRQMSNGASGLLKYNLYTETERTNVWDDDTVSPTGNMSYTGDGTTKQVSIFGRIFGNQTATAGTYNDTVAVTLDY